MKEIHKKAGEIVEEYSTVQATKALEDAHNHMEGKGCQCKNCLGTSVSEANSWLDWHDPDHRHPRFVREGNIIRVRQ